MLRIKLLIEENEPIDLPKLKSDAKWRTVVTSWAHAVILISKSCSYKEYERVVVLLYRKIVKCASLIRKVVICHISNTTGTTCGAGSAYPSRVPAIIRSFWWGSCCLFFSFLCCVMCSIVCLFVFFIFSNGVDSLFSIYEFDCSSGIFRPSFRKMCLTYPKSSRMLGTCALLIGKCRHATNSSMSSCWPNMKSFHSPASDTCHQTCLWDDRTGEQMNGGDWNIGYEYSFHIFLFFNLYINQIVH